MSWFIFSDSEFCRWREKSKGDYYCELEKAKCRKENCPKRIEETEEGKWISQE